MILRNKFALSIIVAGLSISLWAAPAQNAGQSSAAERWVATWTTAEELRPDFRAVPQGGQNTGGSSQAPNAAGSNARSANSAAQQGDSRSPQRRGRGPNLPSSFEDQTVRMIVRTSLGGKRLRVELSNMIGAEPVEIGAAHIAIYKGNGEIVPGSDRALTFGGSSSSMIQPGVLVASDPVDMNVAPLTDLAVSLYLPKNTGLPTIHGLGLHTMYVTKGDMTGATALSNASTMSSYVWLSRVDVVAQPAAFTIVALGDSITDGARTTPDANHNWAAVLAERLRRNKGTENVALVNQGIAGNQVLRDGAGVSALGRLDRDVLSVPGVRWVILLEGINDIQLRGKLDGPDALTADELIWAYRQIIARCHAHNINVLGATITQYEGVRLASARGEAIRQAVNRWIRTKGNFDGVVDFAAITHDPSQPSRMNPKFDSGDHIHPNDAGNTAMANAFQFDLFRK